MSSKPCGELYCHALSSCDMCGRLPFSTEYNLVVPGPQGVGAAPSLQWTVQQLRNPFLGHFSLGTPPFPLHNFLADQWVVLRRLCNS